MTASPPRAATPLAALPVAVLDTETTGLDPERDRIVALAARRLTGATFAETPPLDLRINPQVPIPAASTAIHGLGDADVADQPDFAAIAPEIATFVSGQVVVGHHIGFDLTMLAKESERVNWPWQRPPSLDTGLLATALNPDLPDNSLETIATWLGVDLGPRHTALGDVDTTAAIYAALVPLLSENGVRTLAEAQRFVQRRASQLRGQELAGWHDDSDGAGDLAGSSLPRIDSYPYRHSLADVMSSPPVFTEAANRISTTAALMRAKGISAVLVNDSSNHNITGIITERDLVSALAEHGAAAADMPISKFMAAPVESLPETAPVYRALGRLQRLGIRHLAVTGDRDGTVGQIVGIVSARDLLRQRATDALALGDEIASATSETLGHVMAQLPDVARGLSAEGVSARQIASVISSEIRALTRRAASLAIAEMAEAGKGPPPARWCLLVLGSGGRGESLLALDQDNALIHEGTDETAETWFAEFGARIADMLDAAGVPYCKGGVMAKNAEWRRTPQGWRDAVGHWLSRAKPDDILNTDIFFDYKPVAGTRELADSLYATALRAAGGSPPFLNLLTAMVSGMQAPIGFLGGIRTDGGRVDLKAGGLLPLVSIARVAALRFGIEARSTPDRLATAAELGALPTGDTALLIELHEFILRLVLDQQIADIGAGIPPSTKVDPSRLSRTERKRLRDSLKQLDTILAMAKSTLSQGKMK